MKQSSTVNETMKTFGHPATVVADYDRWVVMLRPQQPTLGALVLVCKEPTTRFSEISGDAFAELKQVTADIEAVLGSAFAFDKINYLMLMMVDPDVHFHVIPRYAQEQEFAGVRFADSGWPRVPDLARTVNLEGALRDRLVAFLRERWPGRRA